MYGTEDVDSYYDLMTRLTMRKDSLTWTELEGMMPFEKEIYIDYLLKFISEEGKMNTPDEVINYNDYRDME